MRVMSQLTAKYFISFFLLVVRMINNATKLNKFFIIFKITKMLFTSEKYILTSIMGYLRYSKIYNLKKNSYVSMSVAAPLTKWINRQNLKWKAFVQRIFYSFHNTSWSQGVQFNNGKELSISYLATKRTQSTVHINIIVQHNRNKD